MGILDNDYEEAFGEYMDKLLATKKEFEIWFSPIKQFSVLVIDSDDSFPLNSYIREGMTIKYFDLSSCTSKDYHRIGSWFNSHIADGEFAYDGIILDNADTMPGLDDNEREFMEDFVWQALKRDEGFRFKDCTPDGSLPILPYPKEVPFGKMAVAVRCKAFPSYLKGKSTSSIIIDTEQEY